MEKKVLIQEAGEILGCHSETLRRAERRGVVSIPRDYRGWRYFTEETLKVLKEYFKGSLNKN